MLKANSIWFKRGSFAPWRWQLRGQGFYRTVQP
jgi:hypothetical protein